MAATKMTTANVPVSVSWSPKEVVKLATVLVGTVIIAVGSNISVCKKLVNNIALWRP